MSPPEKMQKTKHETAPVMLLFIMLFPIIIGFSHCAQVKVTINKLLMTLYLAINIMVTVNIITLRPVMFFCAAKRLKIQRQSN